MPVTAFSTIMRSVKITNSSYRVYSRNKMKNKQIKAVEQVWQSNNSIVHTITAKITYLICSKQLQDHYKS